MMMMTEVVRDIDPDLWAMMWTEEHAKKATTPVTKLVTLWLSVAVADEQLKGS